MLAALKGPVIVLLEGKKINHFVIVKGIINGKVYLADSARGNIWIHYDDFVSQWNRLALVLGKQGFGLPTDHLLALNQGSSPNGVDPQDLGIRNNYRQFQNVQNKFSRLIFPVEHHD